MIRIRRSCFNRDAERCHHERSRASAGISVPALAGEPVLTGDVVWPTDPRYDEARQDYNAASTSIPASSSFAAIAQDVRNAVRWATFHAVPIRPRCGRHSYEGWSLVEDGMWRT